MCLEVRAQANQRRESARERASEEETACSAECACEWEQSFVKKLRQLPQRRVGSTHCHVLVLIELVHVGMCVCALRRVYAAQL